MRRYDFLPISKNPIKHPKNKIDIGETDVFACNQLRNRYTRMFAIHE